MICIRCKYELVEGEVAYSSLDDGIVHGGCIRAGEPIADLDDEKGRTLYSYGILEAEEIE